MQSGPLETPSAVQKLARLSGRLG